MAGGKIIDATLRFVDKFTSPMDKAVSKMEKSARQYQRMGKKIQKAGKQIQKVGSGLTKTVTAPIVGLGAAAVKTAADFESAMSNVQAISGATSSDMGLLSNKAKEMGAKTKFSATEAADAFSYMAMAGWKTQDMLDGIEGVMYLAGASGEDLASTSDIVTDALTAFGMTAKDTNEFVDILAAASNNANTNVSMLGESFKYCAPIAGAMKYSAQDVATSLGLMANSGIKASQAGTSMRSLLTNLAKPTDTVQGAMDRLGISLTDSKGNMLPLVDVVENLRDKFSELTEAEKTKEAAALAGKTGMSGLLAIVNASEKDYTKLAGAIDNSSGAAKRMYDIANDNLTGRLTVLKSTIESIGIAFGERLIPYVEKGIAKLQELGNKFNSLTPTMQDKIIKFAAIAAAAGPVILIFGKMVTGIGTAITMFGKFGGALGKGAKAVNKLSKTSKLFTKLGTTSKSAFGLMLTPGAKVILILAAIVAAGILVYKNWGKIKTVAKSVGNSMKSAFLNSGIQVNKFKASFSNMQVKVSSIVGRLRKDFNKIMKFLKPVLTFLKGVFVAGVKVSFSAAAGAAAGFLSGVMKAADGLITMFGGVITFLEGVFAANWKKAFNGLKTFFSGWGQAVVGLVKTPINAIIGLINGAIDGINSLGLDIPDWVPGVGGKSFSINVPKIPMLYTGTTNWKGGPAMIHDRGAEIVDLPKGSRVYPHDKSLRMAEQKGSSKAKSINITINKLADKIEVKSESDIDKICDNLVNKLVKVMENMLEGAGA